MPPEAERLLTMSQAICEALDQMLADDPSVFLMGEGIDEPRGIFGTSVGLRSKYGPERVLEMPVAENGLTGVAIGSAIVGMRPVMVHQRIDFSLYALDQVINNAAKWYSMFGGRSSVPIVIRTILGQGWGQGNQHSQNLQNLYAHIPGLKVVAPSNAYDAKGLMIAAIRDNNPVIFLEHRWLHNTTSHVPQGLYEVPIGKARVAREGSDITIVTWSYWMVETLKAVEFLSEQGVEAEVIDLTSLSPLDFEAVKRSLQRTGRYLVIDGSWRHGGYAAELITRAIEDPEIELNKRPRRITFPDFCTPSSPALAQHYYPTVRNIYETAGELVGCLLPTDSITVYEASREADVPDKSFTGPF
jgi:pyruvate dehydrogenase E1 component beta subunit